MKKLWLNISIFFGCFLVLVTCLGAVLVLAPGMELLGVMFIRHTSGAVNAVEEVTDATGYSSIYVKCDNAPVNVQFVQSFSFTANLVERYDGFAKAAEEPTVKLSASRGDILVESSEYKPFLAHTRGKDTGLIIKVPIYYTHRLTIEANTSDITFSGGAANLSEVIIKTRGGINVKNELGVRRFVIDAGAKNITLGDSVNVESSLSVTSTSGDLTLPKNHETHVDFKSVSGDLYLNTCGYLKFTSSTGKIKKLGDELPQIFGDIEIETSSDVALADVHGYAKINTKNGDLTIGTEDSVISGKLTITTKSGKVKIGGKITNRENKITTTSGDVILDSVRDVNITTKYGNISIEEVEFAKITSKSGNVEIKTLTKGSEIKTNNGDVSIGSGEESVASQSTISTIGGDIKVSNAQTGEYIISSSTGNVMFSQQEGSEVNLDVKSKIGDVSVGNASGKINLETKGSINIKIIKMLGEINIKGGNNDVQVVYEDNCYFDVTSKKYLKDLPGMKEKSKTYSNVPKNAVESQIVTISTNKGAVIIENNFE